VIGSPSLTAPAQAGQPYRIEAVIANTGPGQGQVDVMFRFRDLATGQAYQREEQADLQPSEQARIVAEIPAPAGNYQPEVDVRYPPS